MNEIIKKIEEEIESNNKEIDRLCQVKQPYSAAKVMMMNTGLIKSIELIKSTYTCKDCENWTPQNYTGHCSKINKLTDCDYRCEESEDDVSRSKNS